MELGFLICEIVGSEAYCSYTSHCGKSSGIMIEVERGFGAVRSSRTTMDCPLNLPVARSLGPKNWSLGKSKEEKAFRRWEDVY